MALAISALRYNYVSIQSPTSGKKAVDLTKHLMHTEYFEDLLSPVITMKMRIRSEFNYIAKVPIRGGEMIAFSAQVGGTTVQFGEIDSDGNITPNSGELYVYKLSDMSAPSQAQDFILNITSVEFLKNETSRCQKKFKSQKISEHVKDILNNVMKVNPDRINKIEDSENSYAFIGNNRKPFYTIEWLCPKSITNSVQGVSGDGASAQGKGTAGFLFYENRNGFNFTSVESLVRSTTLKDNKIKPVQNYVYKGQGATGNPYDTAENISINYFHYSKSTDVRQALSVGQYSNLTIFYDSLEQKFSRVEYKLNKELGDNSKLGENEVEVPKDLDQYISRLYSRVSDHGALGVGELGLEASGRDPVDQAKATSRYNALFSQSLNIQVPCNTNLKIGDIINVTFPELKAGASKDIDKSMSGNYLISRLNHHMQPNASFSSLNLIRDSYGHSEAYPVDTLQSGEIVEPELTGTSAQVQADNEQYGNTFPANSF